MLGKRSRPLQSDKDKWSAVSVVSTYTNLVTVIDISNTHDSQLMKQAPLLAHLVTPVNNCTVHNPTLTGEHIYINLGHQQNNASMAPSGTIGSIYNNVTRVRNCATRVPKTDAVQQWLSTRERTDRGRVKVKVRR